MRRAVRLVGKIALILPLFLAYSIAEPGQPLRDRYELIYHGQPLPEALQPSANILCTSQVTATTGYYPRQAFKGTDLVSALEKQSRIQKWDISLQGDSATDRVESQRYQVVRRDMFGVILVGLEEGATGTTVEVIIIDPSNGSFVSSRSGASMLWKRTNVYVGRCEKR